MSVFITIKQFNQNTEYDAGNKNRHFTFRLRPQSFNITIYNLLYIMLIQRESKGSRPCEAPWRTTGVKVDHCVQTCQLFVRFWPRAARNCRSFSIYIELFDLYHFIA